MVTEGVAHGLQSEDCMVKKFTGGMRNEEIGSNVSEPFAGDRLCGLWRFSEK